MSRAHFELAVRSGFAAAHHLRGYPGDCAKPHGHNYGVIVHLQCQELDSLGIGIDFREVKNTLKSVLGELDHSDLNAHPAFANVNPSAEAIARYIYRTLAGRLDGARVWVARVTVEETPTNAVVYWEDGE
jgi:6-pyruvoyltetrahydropterin/6-carboxytetrahydropterin synthase